MRQAAGVKLFDATVLGDVILHENVNVWYGAVIRGDSDTIEIGKDCRPLLHRRSCEMQIGHPMLWVDL